MALRLWTTALGSRLLQEKTAGLMAPVLQNVNVQTVRYRRAKHWNPKWKMLRRMKVVKIDLPGFDKFDKNGGEENEEELAEEQIRSILKTKGLIPRPWQEKPFFINNSGGIFEAYVPPEGDGKISPIHIQGAKQNLQLLEKKSKTMMAIRKIKSFEDDLDINALVKDLEKIYIKMHECIANNELEDITDLVTERAYPQILHNSKRKTIHWKYIKNIEPPRVVHARTTGIITRENLFAQLTIRFHTKQILAIYDRFGRLIHGSEILAKDVLEYVVFEKHIVNQYGIWRVHGKIIPDWLPPKEPSSNTFLKMKESAPKIEETEKSVEAIKPIEAVSSETTPPDVEKTTKPQPS